MADAKNSKTRPHNGCIAGGDKGHFKAGAYRKVAKALGSFPHVIGEGNLKEVGKLAGVGKASLDKVVVPPFPNPKDLCSH